jgi:serine/threonine protein kinase/TolB-like protein/Flp pilus assembly protein TadD
MQIEPMPPERWEQIEHLYHATLEREPDRRAPFLAETCAGDEALRWEVESLVSAHDRAGALIETPPIEVAAQLMTERRVRSLVGGELGPYRLVALLGEGGMGEVYRAQDTRLDREVAVKVLPADLAEDAEALARFRREARAVAALSHPNIRAIHDVGTERGVQFEVMELLEGETLRSRLARSALFWREAVEIGLAVAEGLRAAHAKGIVHRDLKPENLFLTTDGQVKILDFGIARMQPQLSSEGVSSASALAETTEPGMLMGTVGYMSPEQVRSERAEAPSDVFSFGCVLYEMLTGQRAFARQTAAETMAAILRDEPPPLASGSQEIAPGLGRVIRHCLEKQPEKRFQSASDLVLDLERILTGSPVVRRSPTFSVGRPERIVVEEGKDEPSPVKEDTAAPASQTQTPMATRQAKRGLSVTVAAGIFALLTIALSYVWRAGRPLPAHQPVGTPSIAVLPFQDLSPAKDKEYLCDGLTGELITSLTGLADLRVASRTSVSQYRGRPIDVRRIGEELKVQAVLEGSLRIDGSRIRVIVQLVNTRDGFHLWTHTYDRDIAEISDMQHQVADAIFRRFRIDLRTTRRALVQPPSRNVEAWHHYIRAAYLSRTEPLKSVELYRVAVTSDPNYALAWAGLSLAWVKAVDWEEAHPPDIFPKAADAARRALAIDGTLAEAHQAVARVKVYYEHDWVGAEQAFRRAIEFDPTYLEARLDYAQLVLIPTERFDQAVQELQRALALYPDSHLLLNELANAYIKARQYDKAVEPLEASQKIHQRQLAPWVFLGMVATGLGNYEQALERFQKAASIRRTAWVLSHLGSTYAKLGRGEDALRVAAELEQRPPGRPAFDYELATIYSTLGDKEAAFAALDRAEANQAQGLLWINVDHRLDDLRADSRFGRLLKKMRLD